MVEESANNTKQQGSLMNGQSESGPAPRNEDNRMKINQLMNKADVSGDSLSQSKESRNENFAVNMNQSRSSLTPILLPLEANTNGENNLSVTISGREESESNKRDMLAEEKEQPKKPRKKRKVYSCQECRKMKTRCDFQPLLGKCHRCVVLSIPCSLAEERKEEIQQVLEAMNKNKVKTVFDVYEKDKTQTPQAMQSGFAGLNYAKELESFSSPTRSMNGEYLKLQTDVNYVMNKMKTFEQKLDMILAHIGGGLTKNNIANLNNDNLFNDNDDTEKMNKTNNHGVTIENPPFRLLDQIEKELFGTSDDHANGKLTERELLAKSQRAWVVARQKFMEFFYNHEDLCYKLAHAFLKRAHFWIIPGGIKTIDREYVEKHPFIVSVFAIIAMGFDENENFSTEQEILYPIVERLLSNTLTMFDQLHDHDIEAILYISMYTISRKSKKFRQVKFDGLILSKFATDSLLNLIDFHKIKENVENGLFDGNDLFHLRILNSLTTLKMGYSVGYCNFSIQDKQIREFNDLTVRFPQSTFGDEIKLGEIKLGDIVNSIFLNFDVFFKENLSLFEKETDKGSIRVNAMRSWLETYRELSSKDGSNLLIFTYDFYYIVIFRNILSEFATKSYETFLQNKDYYLACLSTIKKYCFAILTAFLQLPTSLIKGCPIITLQQTVYSCLSLCDFLLCFNTKEKAKILNLCTKIYWHLNSIGEKLNEATQNVGIIIKTLIDSSLNQSSKQNKDGSVMNMKDLFLQMQNGCKHNNIKRKKNQVSRRNLENHSSISSVTSKQKGGNSNNNSVYSPSGNLSNASSINNDHTPGGTLNRSTHTDRHSNSALYSSLNGNMQMPQFNFGNPLLNQSVLLPDVEQFQSFEDFFQDFFQNRLKPSSQNMFQGN